MLPTVTVVAPAEAEAVVRTVLIVSATVTSSGPSAPVPKPWFPNVPGLGGVPPEAGAQSMTVPDQDRHPLTRPSRRQMIQGLVGLSLSAGGLTGCSRLGMSTGPALNGSPETTRIRVHDSLSLCQTPQYVVEELLRAEGFTDVQYVQLDTTSGADAVYSAFATGEIDVSMAFAGPFIMQVDQGAPVVLLGGVHVGCFEVFGNDSVRAILDLKGKIVGVTGIGSAPHLFLASVAAYIGLDPRVDINWLGHRLADSATILTDGTVDALISIPPVPQELRAKKIGQVILNSSLDKPWSQYFCCTLAANRDWAQQHPVAAKAALRAILKATDICANEPERVAQHMVDGGFTPNYDYALQTLKDIPYDRWREYELVTRCGSSPCGCTRSG
ncbi:MAG TPA: ABC transporter substrate-binding protein [Kribbellaceae bacterium]|nr:ABC transporter substrate-binding protein [Kribbellaceae bacterium]